MVFLLDEKTESGQPYQSLIADPTFMLLVYTIADK